MTATGFEAPGISSFYFPHLGEASDAVGEWTYLLCLVPAYKHAEHYLGSARDLAARLRQHGTIGGARLLQVQREAGGTFVLVRTWSGGRDVEYHLKARKEAPVLCPRCTPGTQRGKFAPPVAPAVPLFPAPAPPKVESPAGLVVPCARPVLATWAARGRRWGHTFLAEHDSWSAEEIEQAAAELQGPYYEGPRTPEGDAFNAAFGRVVERALAAHRIPLEMTA